MPSNVLLPIEIIEDILLKYGSFTLVNGLNRFFHNNSYVKKKLFLANCPSMDLASAKGNVALLQYHKDLFPVSELHYSEMAMGFASENNHVHVLEWFLRSSLPLKWNEYALDAANRNGHLKVLEWFLISSLRMKWTKSPVDIARKSGNAELEKWWFMKSGQPVVYNAMSHVHTNTNCQIF
jgi:hypothetical protein